MFGKVLIANRGEIACRIQRTLRRLGIRSVAVHSEADTYAEHVSRADEAVAIGPAAVSQSYLDAARILDAARQTGAGAIHPGYGLLSENADFAEACEAAGLRFIGPTPEQMRRFGLKHTARELAEASRVPLLPGTGLLDTPADACREAARIGYPIMLKSTAGGGGIGMRRCADEAELLQAFEARYLVLGLGDVYLGAPVATPMDPRHRLVTTKYNPARTWTPENAVGIGGAYLCIYGMEGPGGYQFVGRTVPVWNRWWRTSAFVQPWLLRFFDEIRFYPMPAEELTRFREDLLRGRVSLRIEPGTFSLADYNRFLEEHAESIRVFRKKQRAAFDEERERWAAANLSMPDDAAAVIEDAAEELAIPEGLEALPCPITGNIWKLPVAEGDRVTADQLVAVVEAMKMEAHVNTPVPGTIERILVQEGSLVQTGQNLLLIRPDTP